MAEFTYSTLTTAILNWSETDTSVISSTISDQMIANAEERVFRDVNIDAYRYYFNGTCNIGQGNYNAPSGLLVMRAIRLKDSAENEWYLEKVDQTFLDEYTQDRTNNTAAPRYWAMYDGGDGSGSGYFKIAPPPDAAYHIQAEYIKMPEGLSSTNTSTYISKRFGNGLLYAALVEAYAFLKGPIDMLTYFENRYKQEIDKFGLEQIGRRRRGDYTSGTIRIPLNTPSTTEAGTK